MKQITVIIMIQLLLFSIGCQNVSLHTKKNWKERNITSWGVKLNLQTRWREGYLHFIFTVSPYNNEIPR